MALKGLSDNNLLNECGKDNLKAFDTLFERYSGKLYKYALRYINDEHFGRRSDDGFNALVWEKRHTLSI
jgi:DNA-directed RNA polymerase specialized sigma24 family protein